MGKYQDTSVIQLLNDINEKIFLPEIQREFVWDTDRNKFEDKLYDLFDSIIRGYPIGTLLLWEVKHKDLVKDNITVLNFLEDNSKTNEIKNTANFKDKEISLVLDGQQRLTILNLAFKGVFVDNYYKKKRKKYLYFNLLSSPKKNQEVNERKYELKIFESDKDYFFDKDKLWFSVSNFLSSECTKSEFKRKLCNEFKIEKDEEKDRINDNLNDFKDSIQNLNISYYSIDHSKSDEEALEIFVRVNSGGVILTYSDLLFSKIKHHWKKGEDKIDAREEFKDFLEEINSNSFKFDNDFLLKSSLFLINKDIRYRLKNFNKENVLLIKKIWEDLKKSMKTSVEVLKSMGINSSKVLRSNNSIIPIIYYVYKNQLQSIEPDKNDYRLIKKYIYLILLNRVFGGQSDELLSTTRNILNTNSGNFPLTKIISELKKKKPILTEKEELLEIINDSKYKSDKNQLILNLIYNNQLIPDFQEDHMFPRKRTLKRYDKKDVDNIANIQALGAQTNASKNDKKFQEWVKKREDKSEYCKYHLVPDMVDYDEKYFPNFLKKRKDLIKEKLSSALGLN